MITKKEAIEIVENYIEQFNPLDDIKVPIYESRLKKIQINLLKWYGNLLGRTYYEHKFISPDGWKTVPNKLVVLKDGVYEDSYCWLIAYNSQRYNETNDYRYCLIGPGPVLIDKRNGNAYSLGSGDSNYIEDFHRFVTTGSSSFGWGLRLIEI